MLGVAGLVRRHPRNVPADAEAAAQQGVRRVMLHDVQPPGMGRCDCRGVGVLWGLLSQGTSGGFWRCKAKFASRPGRWRAASSNLAVIIVSNPYGLLIAQLCTQARTWLNGMTSSPGLGRRPLHHGRRGCTSSATRPGTPSDEPSLLAQLLAMPIASTAAGRPPEWSTCLAMGWGTPAAHQALRADAA